MCGWIKLHRTLQDWEWYKDANTKALFLHLLIVAETKDRRDRGVLLKRGDVRVVGTDLQEILGLSRQQLRVAFEHLKTSGDVEINNFYKFMVVRVTRYESYQEGQFTVCDENGGENLQNENFSCDDQLENGTLPATNAENFDEKTVRRPTDGQPTANRRPTDGQLPRKRTYKSRAR